MSTQQTNAAQSQVTIIARNRQGASETHKGTQAECLAWFAATWADPENMSYEIHDEGRVLATKPFADDAE